MTFSLSVFYILFAFMIVDNEIVVAEIDVIIDYIKRNYYKVDFDPIQAMKELSGLDRQQVIERFIEALAFINHKLSLDEKRDIIRYVVDVITADDKVRKTEGFLFDLVRNVWGIDTKTLVKYHSKDKIVSRNDELSMTKAAFYILIGFMIADGEIDEKEVAVILSALRKHYKDIDFDLPYEINLIKKMERKERIDRFVKAIEYVDQFGDKNDKHEIINYVTEMIICDGFVDEHETYLLDMLLKQWNIDINEYNRSCEDKDKKDG